MTSLTACRIDYTVVGLVQGVGFREATRRAAVALGITGWVANLPDGSVAGVAEGDEEALAAFTAFLHEGPRFARVQSVQTTPSAACGEFSDFAIRRGQP